MTDQLPGLLLAPPFGEGFLQALLFGGFLFHLVFVLLTLGTALLAVFYYLKDRRPAGPTDAAWDRRALRTFIVHKSIAVALGVGPLLLIQVGHPVPFFNATSLFAPQWMAIVALLIVASLIFDGLAHLPALRRGLHLTLGVIALILLLGVPAVFVAVLVTAEQSAGWPDIIAHGYRLTGALGWHWLFRYVHVLAAGIIFGAVFHYVFTSRGNREKKAAMLNWILFGIMAQAVIGPMLTLTLVLRPDATSIVLLFFGLLALAAFIRIVADAGGGAKELNLKLAVPILLVIAFFMLTVRQHQQDRAFSGIEAKAAEEANRYAAVLQPYEEAALGRYKKDVETVYDNGPTIYAMSCAFCHNANGDGKGPEHDNLTVPPEGISAIRTTRPYVYKMLTEGIEGSAMPYFTVFTKDKLDRLIDFMNERWQILGPVPAVDGVSPEDKAEAVKTYAQVCAGCHGPDGRPAPNAAKFKPPPPDFTQYSLLPERALEVIHEGYHGTVMGPFGRALKPETKTALVQVLYDLRK